MSLEKYNQLKRNLSTKEAELKRIKEERVHTEEPSDVENQLKNEIANINNELENFDVSTLHEDLTKKVKSSLQDEKNEKYINDVLEKKINWTISGSIVLSFDIDRTDKDSEVKSNFNIRFELDFLQKIFKVGFHYLDYESSISVNILLLMEWEKSVDHKSITAAQMASLIDVQGPVNVNETSTFNFIGDINLELYDAFSIGIFRLPSLELTVSRFSSGTSRNTIEQKLKLINLAKTANKESRAAIEAIVSKSNQHLKDKASAAASEKEADAKSLSAHNLELLDTLKGIKTILETSNPNKK